MDGLHVSPCVVPRVVAALHDAGVLAGAPLRRGSSHELFIIQHNIYNIMAVGQKSHDLCCLASGSDLLLKDSAFWALTHDRCEKRLNI